MLKVFNHRVYGMNESLRASGYPMRADNIGEWSDEDNYDPSLDYWLNHDDFNKIINIINYKPDSWNRLSPNEIKLINGEDFARLIFRDNEGQEIGFSKIDFEDIVKISEYKWNLSNIGYAFCCELNMNLHKFLEDYNNECIVDHKNKNKLDNRRKNLRKCTPQENVRNAKKSKNNNSGVVGVNYREDRKKWRAFITINSKQISLGNFENFEDAVVSRLNAELIYFREFSPQINMMEEYGIKHNFKEDDFKIHNLKLAVEHYNRAVKLFNAKPGSGHDCALKGIVVQFDVTYPVYWTPQFQRYNFTDIVSSTSAMHRLHKLDLDESMNKYVLPGVKALLKSMINAYNEGLSRKVKEISLIHELGKDMVTGFFFEGDMVKLVTETHWAEKVTMYELYMRILSNCPQGLMKTMRVSTNYLQLKTIYLQRRHHKLKEDWGNFCDWCETLPNFEEWCLSKK